MGSGPQNFRGTALVHVALASSLSSCTLLNLHLLIRKARAWKLPYRKVCWLWLILTAEDSDSPLLEATACHCTTSLQWPGKQTVCSTLSNTAPGELLRTLQNRDHATHWGSHHLQALLSPHPLAGHSLGLKTEGKKATAS